MVVHDTARRAVLIPILFALLARARPVVRQERTFVRVVHLTLGCVLSLGRHTPSQMLVVLGLGGHDWSAWYRLFNVARIDVAGLHQHVLAEVARVVEVREPVLAVVVDGTQLPRTSRRFPGCGFVRQPRTPPWRRGIHLAQRYVGISALLPRSVQGDSRAIPLKWTILRTSKTTPMGDAPEQGEAAGGVALLHWLRDAWDALGRSQQPLLALGDGSYSTATVLRHLPDRTVLLARCAKNRAL